MSGVGGSRGSIGLDRGSGCGLGAIGPSVQAVGRSGSVQNQGSVSERRTAPLADATVERRSAASVGVVRWVWM